MSILVKKKHRYMSVHIFRFNAFDNKKLRKLAINNYSRQPICMYACDNA